MEWEGREESENVEDRRAFGRKAGYAIGGLGGLVVLVIALFLGVDPQKLMGPGGLAGGAAGPGGPAADQQAPPADPEEERQARFTKVIFHDTEVVWGDLFKNMGKRYENPVLVLYSGQVDSACGMAEAAVGPFYCPGDSRVYIDLSFYRDMERNLHAPGEFARAYVVAHEVGHHVQRLLGYSRLVDQARRTMGKAEYNKMSVRLELQADYLAGVWAHHGQEQFKFLTPGDVESALKAAFEIGDDRLQKKARGTVVPDAFTHGTSKQRMRWFKEGFETGDVNGAGRLFKLDYQDL
jgi:predicted metalloprotease